MYELIILAHLLRKPMHGYLIAKIINDQFGPFAKLSNGRFYPLLTKLEKEGLIAFYDSPETSQHGERTTRSYQITDEGRERFHKIMMDIGSNPGEYSRIFLIKAGFIDLVELPERLLLIDHYLNYCQAHILHLGTEKVDLEHHGIDYQIGTAHVNNVTSILQHMIDGWKLELDWTQHLRERVLSEAEGFSPSDLPSHS